MQLVFRNTFWICFMEAFFYANAASNRFIHIGILYAMLTVNILVILADSKHAHRAYPAGFGFPFLVAARA